MRSELDYAALGEQVRSCTACPLCTTRYSAVVDRGNPAARLLFVGEAPGASEDAAGQAFVGPAGALLDAMIEDAGIGDDEFLLINVLKCRPPNNKFPGDEDSPYKDADEIVPKCLPWLDRQIELVNPRAIVLVGRKAAEWTVYRERRPAPTMGAIAGRWIRCDRYRNAEIFAIFHPAYLLRLRQYDPSEARYVTDQTLTVLEWAKAVITDGTVPDGKPIVVREPKPTQGRLF